MTAALRAKGPPHLGEIRPNDFGTLVVSAVRYALGRRTYITGDTARIVSRHRTHLSEATIAIILRDIREAERAGGLGDECDRRAWLALREKLEELVP